MINASLAASCKGLFWAKMSVLPLYVAKWKQYGFILNQLNITRAVSWAPDRTKWLFSSVHYAGGPWRPPPPKLQFSEVTWPRSRFNTSGPDPLGFDWEGLAANWGTAGGHNGPPTMNSLGIDSRKAMVAPGPPIYLGW